MKLHHLMDNKIGRASGGINERHDPPSARAADVEVSMAGTLDNLEVNANEVFCAREVAASPKSPFEDVYFGNSGELLETSGLMTEDSGISENSLSLTEELEVEKILNDITERDESVDDVTDSEESIGSNGRGGSETFRDASIQPSNKSRTIGQIRESLEQKVRRLRDEKAAVDEKIRLAQEEEDMRRREKIKLKQQLVVHRRDRLKKVITDLKRKLEDQSIRLQVTYSTLISLQRNVFRHRSFSRSRTENSRDSSLEAPF